ncbi:MAG TPA: hypothetical protein VNK43_04780 [Gemmatimonadales bacterium]|nr:hypothetical protein [Gemmatimonadales bacterium]
MAGARIRLLAAGLLGAGLLAGCGGESSPGRSRPAAPERAAADAERLGREVYDVVDRVMSYRTSHRGRLPRSLRELGLDSLTPATVRRLAQAAGRPSVTVAFRRPAERALAWCRGTDDVLDEATFEGGFTLVCADPAGAVDTFRVPR